MTAHAAHLPCPPEALKAAEAACGSPIELRQITNRRGSATWKATGPLGAAAVKVGLGEGAAITAREAAVLRAMEATDYLIDSGWCGDSSWLAARWFDGPSTWELFQPIRDGFGPRAQAAAAAVELCSAVADLHTSGWVHGDLQPAHAIHTCAGARLIDRSWSWRPGMEPPDIFRGGNPHLLAPELAASVVRGERPVKPTVEAETYTMAAVLWTCATGSWPLDYAAAGIDRSRVTAEALRAAIGTGRLQLAPAGRWPRFEKALRTALAPDPAQRTGLHQLGAALNGCVD